jgi:hypothetical protein
MSVRASGHSVTVAVLLQPRVVLLQPRVVVLQSRTNRLLQPATVQTCRTAWLNSAFESKLPTAVYLPEEKIEI